MAVSKLQDLADVIGEVAQEVASQPLTITVRLEVGGDPSEEVVEAVNELLGDVSIDLQLI